MESTPKIVSIVMICTYGFIGYLFAKKFGIGETIASK